MAYDAMGNITSKTGMGTYTYHATKKHQVVSTGANSYAYDANGNMSSRAGSSITWYSYDLPNTINGPSSNSSQFFYAPDRSRWKQVASYVGTSEQTIYIGGLVEKTILGGITSWKHYIAGAHGAVALHIRRSSGTNETDYLLKDHLGSVDMITRSDGSQMSRLSFDAWGRRRNGGTWSGNPAAAAWTAITNTTRRGFTSHEALDNLGLVHMNGRVYDPVLARFLSADPIVQAPGLTQSFNRYSYVFNNPLTFIDPSGYQGSISERPSIRPDDPNYRSYDLTDFNDSVDYAGDMSAGTGGFSEGIGLAPEMRPDFISLHRDPLATPAVRQPGTPPPADVTQARPGYMVSAVGRTFAEDAAIRRRAMELGGEGNLAAVDLALDGAGATLDIARGLSLVDLRITGTHWVRTFDGYWQANRLTVPARDLWNSADGLGGTGGARLAIRSLGVAATGLDLYQTSTAIRAGRLDEAAFNGVDVIMGVGGVFVPPLGVGYFLGKGIGTLAFPEPPPTSVFDRIGYQD